MSKSKHDPGIGSHKSEPEGPQVSDPEPRRSSDDAPANDGHYQYDFFLAYANADSVAATRLYDLLVPYSRVFLDKRVLKPGAEWSVELPRAQRNSRITVVLVSSNSDKAYYQREEIAMAIQMARREEAGHLVVPVLLDEMHPPEDTMPYGLWGRQAVYCLGENPFAAAARKLLDLLEPWWPHPERDEFFEARRNDRAWRAGPPLSARESGAMLGRLSQSTEKMARAANHLASMLEGVVTSGVRIFEFLKSRQERARLRLLLGRIANLYASQNLFPELIRRYCQKPGIYEWDFILVDAAVLADSVAELSTLLSTADGEFVVHCRDAYLALMVGLAQRQDIYRQLRRMDAPTDQHSINLPLHLADSYDALIAGLRRSDVALAEYFQRGGAIADRRLA